MFRFTEPGGFELTSISGSGADGWLEVEADGIYWIDLLKESDAAFHSKKMSYPSTIPSVFDDGRAFYPLELNNVTPIEGQEIPHLNALSPAVATLETLLRKSVSLRVSHIPTWWPLSESGPSTSPAKLAILFSGGLDCTVLARLAHDILDTSETIDLLNVAFENPRVHRQKTADPDFSPYESCPDRLTGRASFAELQLVCPGREWRFVAINIPYTETIAHRAEVMGLMHPHNTEMDLSIAYALYFAARGSGLLVRTAQEPTTPYTTTARVLLSGLGADELFGGYSRHGMAFNRRGYAGLIEELGLDIGRLGKRNLGRDDRVISNWGREARFPYLDEDFVHWALQAPVWEKCGFGEQPVEGKVDGGKQVDGSELLEPGKKVLRCLAWKLGMKSVASEKKRAIQFGARTAKMEVSRIKGTQLLT
ncbi:hypothetical protein H2203_001356 [Taxawa tesnikishii (nom. ined.)]|nr:hypothetical protein H2203_001356 [Dothideales sp. JES 119]